MLNSIKLKIFIVLISCVPIQYLAFQFEGIIGWTLLTLAPSIWTAIFGRWLLNSKVSKSLRFYSYTVLLLGPFATLGGFFLLIIPSKKQFVEQYRELLAQEVVFSSSEKLEFGVEKNYWSKDQAIVTPFIDTMKTGEKQLKFSVIDKVVQLPGSYSKQILDIGLEDEDQDVRFYAASGTVILNDNFLKRFRDFQKKIDKDPTNTKNYLGYAKVANEFCDSGLVEAADMNTYFRKMKGAYKNILDISPIHEVANIGLVRVYIKEKNYDEALALINEATIFFPDSTELQHLEARSLFGKKEYTQLKKIIKEYENLNKIKEIEIKDSIEYWKKKEQQSDSFWA